MSLNPFNRDPLAAYGFAARADDRLSADLRDLRRDVESAFPTATGVYFADGEPDDHLFVLLPTEPDSGEVELTRWWVRRERSREFREMHLSGREMTAEERSSSWDERWKERFRRPVYRDPDRVYVISESVDLDDWFCCTVCREFWQSASSTGHYVDDDGNLQPVCVRCEDLAGLGEVPGVRPLMANEVLRTLAALDEED